jgi:hypothetical protein
VGVEAEKLGYSVFSVDWENYKDIDLVVDIEFLTKKQIPFTPDIVWASPDCTTYSIASCSTHRKNSIEPLTKYAEKSDRVNYHFIELIKQWLIINPDMIFFIENPRGMMRKMPFIKNMRRETVWYCKYGDNRAKPTDIWTNSKSWMPRPQCFNGNTKCHHEPAPRGSDTGTQGRSGSYDRSIIPRELCREILNSINKQNRVLF